MNKQGHRTRLLVRGALLPNCCSFSPQPCLFFPSPQPQISYCCSNENAAIRLHTAHKRHTTIAVTATMLCVRLVPRRLSAFATGNCSSLLWDRTQVAADAQKGSHILAKAQNHHLSRIQWPDTKLVPQDNALWYVKSKEMLARMITLFEAMKMKRGITNLCKGKKPIEINETNPGLVGFFVFLQYGDSHSCLGFRKQ